MLGTFRRIEGLTLAAALTLQPLLGTSPAVSAESAPRPGVATATDTPRILPRQGTMRFVKGRLVQDGQAPIQPPIQPPVQPPVQPPSEAQPAPSSTQAAVNEGSSDNNFSEFLQSTLGQAGKPEEIVTSEDPISKSSTDLGQFLHKSASTNSVDVQRRSPVAMDPNIRGYKQGQIYTQADGQYWLPARQDLDTMLNKIDPTMIDNVVIINGPYGVLYGPGLTFINVETAATPRCQDAQFRTTANIRTNGGQLYGRETVSAGGADYGYRLSYGHLKGSDYLSGDGTQIPASYENRDVWAQWGYDLTPFQHVEFNYKRLDQTDTEFPAEFFNIDDLVTDGFNVRLTDNDPAGPWTTLLIDAWWNRTRYNGDNLGKNNPNFPEVQRAELSFLNFNFPGTQFPNASDTITAFTAGDLTSTGGRGMLTFGEKDEHRLNIGSDFRYLEQNITENIFVDVRNPDINFVVNTNLPRSEAVDPGLFAEYVAPWNSYATSRLGGRVDFYNTRANASEIPSLRLNSFPGGAGDLDQEDTLYAFYLANELQLDANWTAMASFGHAQRAPTLIERYADGLFLGIAQSGYTRVVGDPNLDKERDWQIDFGLRSNYDNWRMRANFFYAWIEDYVTLEGSNVIVPTVFDSARLLQFVNTNQATLTGFELAGEVDCTPYWSPFASLKYVEGVDQVINEPLPQIPPLDGTVGIRLHEPSRQRLWSIDLGLRMVSAQDRIGIIRGPGPNGVVPLEERTPGFSAAYLRGYYNYSRNLNLVAGIDNLFDRNYQEHLDLRLLGPANFPGPATRVLAPGFTPYFGIDWTF